MTTFLLELAVYVFAATVFVAFSIFVVGFWWMLGTFVRRAIRYRSVALALRELLN